MICTFLVAPIDIKWLENRDNYIVRELHKRHCSSSTVRMAESREETSWEN
jgi:hypothetical protein